MTGTPRILDFTKGKVPKVITSEEVEQGEFLRSRARWFRLLPIDCSGNGGPPCCVALIIDGHYSNPNDTDGMVEHYRAELTRLGLDTAEWRER